MALVETLTALYEAHRDASNASAMSAYMKHRFAFFGIKTPARKALSKQALERCGVPPREAWEALCEDCFAAPERELQYFIGDWLRPKWDRLPRDLLPLCETMILTKSWWDTVDWLAPRLAGGILLEYPDLIAQYPDRWVASENRWLQRSALLFQLHYKSDTDDERLFAYCERLASSGEFFVQKGMGWALRERSKYNPAAVLAFLNRQEVSPLTRREALRWLVKAGMC